MTVTASLSTCTGVYRFYSSVKPCAREGSGRYSGADAPSRRERCQRGKVRAPADSRPSRAIDLPSGTCVVGLRGSQERQAGQRAREGVRAEPVR